MLITFSDTDYLTSSLLCVPASTATTALPVLSIYTFALNKVLSDVIQIYTHRARTCTGGRAHAQHYPRRSAGYNHDETIMWMMTVMPKWLYPSQPTRKKHNDLIVYNSSLGIGRERGYGRFSPLKHKHEMHFGEHHLLQLIPNILASPGT